MSQGSVMGRFAGVTRILAVVVALLLVGSLFLALRESGGERTLVAEFPQTNALYEGSEVRVLGVPVGKVTEIEPKGSAVRVTMEYDDTVKIPSDAKALVVSPQIVGDRFVQLAPAYSGGAALKDKAFLPLDRTQVPVELDAIYQSLDDLSLALGPEGANKDGALSRLLDDTAGQLDGQGAQLNQTIRDVGKLTTTLSNNKDDLFGTVDEVQQFVRLLRDNDDTVRAFNDSTAEVSEVLEGERGDLKEALRLLSLALIDVDDLIKDNRGELRDNVKNLRTLTTVLANRDTELEEVGTTAPSALVNVALAYNPGAKAGSLDTHANLPELIEVILANPQALAKVLPDLLKNLPADIAALLESLLGGLLGTGPTPGGGAGAAPSAQGDDDQPRTTPTSGDIGSPQGSLREMLGVS